MQRPKGPATTLREMRMTCRAGALTPSELDVFFEDTSEARNPRSDLGETILRKLEEEAEAKILVFGHGGCGKSTELVRIQTNLQKRYLIVGFSIIRDMNLTAIHAEDIILIMVERLIRVAKEAGVPVQDEDVKPIFDWFAEETEKEQTDRGSKTSVGGGAKVSSGFFTGLLDLFVEYKGEIQYEAHNENTKVFKLRKRASDLITQANVLISVIRRNLPAGQDLLFIVEDLDKLDLKPAHDVFVRNANLLCGLGTNIIYTVPIFTFHDPKAARMRTAFRHCVGLPMVKTHEPNGERALGFEVIRRMVHKRVAEGKIKPEALDYLIERTGGVLQHVLEVLVIVANIRNVQFPITKDDIRYGLDQKRQEFWREIAPPRDLPDGYDKITHEDLYNRLRTVRDEVREIRKRNASRYPAQPPNDPLTHVLLMCCAFVEYNGKGWIGVHPLVEEMLDEQDGTLDEQD